MLRRLVVPALCLIVVGYVCASAVAGSIVQTYVLMDSNAPMALAPRTVVSNAVDFSLTYGAGLTGNAQAQAAFDQAAANWEALLNDNVTVRLTVDYQSLGAGILGSTSSTMLYGGFDLVRNLVAANAGETNTAREAALLPNLPTAAEFSALLPTGSALDGNSWLSQANYHALGGTGFDTNDGTITFSSNYAWDFDPSDGITAGQFDFVGVAMHEMGHALGFSSEVDYVDVNMPVTDVWPRPLDYFRFRPEDLLNPSFDFTDTPRMLAPGGEHAFYFGDGTVLMSTGQVNGDGRQASHWKDSLGLGLMDPTAAPGELLMVSENDLIALDLIGWDVVYSSGTVIPEPISMILFGTGVVSLFGVVARRKRQR